MQMSKWSRNIEGYADSTAGIAIESIERGKEECYGEEKKLQTNR